MHNVRFDAPPKDAVNPLGGGGGGEEGEGEGGEGGREGERDGRTDGEEGEGGGREKLRAGERASDTVNRACPSLIRVISCLTSA